MLLCLCKSSAAQVTVIKVLQFEIQVLLHAAVWCVMYM